MSENLTKQAVAAAKEYASINDCSLTITYLMGSWVSGWASKSWYNQLVAMNDEWSVRAYRTERGQLMCFVFVNRYQSELDRLYIAEPWQDRD